jgi:hypothetical protein
LVRWPISRRSNWAKVASMFAIASPLRGRRINLDVQDDHAPALPLRLRHQPGEVEQRTRQPIQLRDHQRLRVAGLEYLQRGLDPGPDATRRRQLPCPSSVPAQLLDGA